MKIDKKGWQKVRLADVTIKKEENDKENASSRFNRFLKVEHLDADSLHIKRWGTIGEEELPPTFYKVFRKGQILYPTRNPHLRRVALADFDGICGEKTLTIEHVPELIDEKFFPFIFLSHAFVSHTISSIVGSTNPHVRWRDVAEYEFLLPPKDQQVRIAELLWAADQCVCSLSLLHDKLEFAYLSLINTLIPEPKQDFYLLNEVGTNRKGLTYKSEDYADENEGVPLINLKSIERGGGFNKDGIKYYNGKYSDNHFVKYDDIVIACTDITRGGNVIGYPLDPRVYIRNEMLFTMDLIALEIDKNLYERDFIYYLLKTKWAHSYLFANSSGTTVLHLNINAAMKLKIPRVSLFDQKKIIEKIDDLRQEMEICLLSYEHAKLIQKQLINQVFG